MKQTISTDKAPKAIGPYSQAVVYGGLAYLSGQIAIDPASNKVIEGGISAQTERVLGKYQGRSGSLRRFARFGSEDYGVPEGHGRFRADEPDL